MKLSVLVLGLTDRNTSYLLYHLNKQATEDVEILSLIDNRSYTVSEKRNILINLAHGDYVCFVDDDDTIEDNYIEELLKATAHNTDVINFTVWITIDNWSEQPVYYGKDYENTNKEWAYYRQPNHIMAIKRDIALLVPYENIPAEDTVFATKINQYLKTEYIIDKTLYHYDFKTNRSACQWTLHYTSKWS